MRPLKRNYLNNQQQSTHLSKYSTLLIFTLIGTSSTCWGQRQVWSLLGSTGDNGNLVKDKQSSRRSFMGSAFASFLVEADENVDNIEIESEDYDEKISQIDEKDLRGKCEIGFENVSMVLTNKRKGDRQILKAITGKALPGRMLAVMGPSGSGKSSLINAISGRLKLDKKVKLTGRRYINNDPLDGESKIPAAFIEQETLFFPHMTVKETLDFRVELKLGRKLGKSARDDVVTDLMDQFSLTKSANTKVGSAKIRGISGGERKRLSIACEMISSPPVIFLDEPTSGLDSYQAEQVVATMKKLANDGVTIIAVIHQPSQKVFSMFDDLLLLSEGRQMYFGEVNKVRSHFSSLGFSASSDEGTAEYVIECISRITGDKETEAKSLERFDRLSSDAQKMSNKINFKSDRITPRKRNFFGEVERARPATNFLRQFKLLLMRSLNEVFRGKGAIIIKIVQQVTLGLVYGSIYHLGTDQSSIMDRFGLLSLVIIGSSNMAVAGTVRSFPKEKAIVGTEIASKMYNTFPYFISKAISEIPPLLIYSGIFGSIIYPLVGLNPAKGRFQKFIGLTGLHTIAAEAAGLLIGSLAPNTDVALALLPPVLVLSIIFDGKNIADVNVPKAFRWVQEIGLVRWGFEALCVNEFVGLNFETNGPQRGPVVKTGLDALARFGLKESNLGKAINGLVRVIAAGWTFSILGLTFTRQKFQTMLDDA